MKTNRHVQIFLLRGFLTGAALGLLTGTHTRAQLLIDAESGAVFPGIYNQIQRPQTAQNTRFDAFGPAFKTNPVLNVRLRLGYTFNNRHTISVLYAPLVTTSTYQGNGTQPIVVEGVNFAPTPALRVKYGFSGYRFTYRYDFIRQERLRLGLGLTINIRDALVEVSDGQRMTHYTNLGPVPLLNLYANWRPTNRVGLVLETDAFAVPGGRAVDVFTGLTYRLATRLNIKGGYRLLDGIGDQPEVYNLIRTNSAVIGLRYGL